jgi:hypothetical protein
MVRMRVRVGRMVVRMVVRVRERGSKVTDKSGEGQGRIDQISVEVVRVWVWVRFRDLESLLVDVA